MNGKPKEKSYYLEMLERNEEQKERYKKQQQAEKFSIKLEKVRVIKGNFNGRPDNV